jgi:hypothetical protein
VFGIRRLSHHRQLFTARHPQHGAKRGERNMVPAPK